MLMFFLFSLGCTDLPEGWEDALVVEDFTQGQCQGDPYGDYDETVTAEVQGADLAFDWRQAPFRCEQDVEGFYRTEGDRLQVLVQPRDMHPTSVAKCDCLYDLTFAVPDWDGPWDAYRRWDAINDPNEPVLVGSSEE